MTKIFWVIVIAGSLAAWTLANGNFRGSANAEIVSVAPTATGIEMTANGSGYATRLGRYTREETIVLDPSTGSFSGLATFRSASGDFLYAEVAGNFTSQTTAEGTYNIFGGTGRFEDARGEAEFSVTILDETHFTADFAGSLSLRLE